MRSVGLIVVVAVLLGCKPEEEAPAPATPPAVGQGDADASAEQGSALARARRGFTTSLTSAGEDQGPADAPPAGVLDLVHYDSPVGPLVAYLSPDPGDGQRHPAILWITGGDNNTIGDVWSDSPRDNDQTARQFRAAGVVTMYPSQRGGNDNPGRREGFLGEVDDILAAADYAAALPYVDPERLYLGGHSTGGTLAMLVAECSDRFQAVFSLGPVASPSQYGGSFAYYDIEDESENDLRSPYLWLDSVSSPLYVIEGLDGNWQGAVRIMAENNANKWVQIFGVPGHDHFTVIAPVNELIAAQIKAGEIRITAEMLEDLR